MISQTSSSASSGAQRAVAGEVPVGPLGDEVGVGEVEVAAAALVVLGPAGDFVVDERLQLRAAITAGHVERDVLGPLLHGPLDLGQRRRRVVVAPALARGSPSSSAARAPSEPGATGTGSGPGIVADYLGEARPWRNDRAVRPRRRQVERSRLREARTPSPTRSSSRRARERWGRPVVSDPTRTAGRELCEGRGSTRRALADCGARLITGRIRRARRDAPRKIDESHQAVRSPFGPGSPTTTTTSAVDLCGRGAHHRDLARLRGMGHGQRVVRLRDCEQDDRVAVGGERASLALVHAQHVGAAHDDERRRVVARSVRDEHIDLLARDEQPVECESARPVRTVGTEDQPSLPTTELACTNSPFASAVVVTVPTTAAGSVNARPAISFGRSTASVRRSLARNVVPAMTS